MYAVIHKRWAIYVVAAVLSVLISVWASVREFVINPDAICYLQSAETMKMGLSIAMSLCDQAKWPFYSFLIYHISKLTHLSPFYSASFLDGMFSLVSVLTFMGIVQFLKPTARMVWLAAFIILCSHGFNIVKGDIIRDHGFWTFYLLSLFFLLQYFRKPEWRFAIAWNVSLVLATLFRIEGLIFLLILPFIAWLDFTKTWLLRFKAFLQLNTLILCGFLILALWVLFHSEQVAGNLGRVGEVEFQLLHGVDVVTQHFRNNAKELAQHVLSVYATGDASAILFLMLGSWYIFSVISNLTILYALLLIYAWWKQLSTADKPSQLVLWAYVLVNVAITAIFLVENMFLSKRYLLALSLTLMIWLPFALDNLVQQWQKRKWTLVLAMLLIVLSFISSMTNFGYSKIYIRHAGEWLATNTPQSAKIYSNDYQVMYYSDHFANTIFEKAATYANVDVIANDAWKQYDYVALRFTKKDLQKETNIIKEINLTPVQVFTNTRGDRVAIFKIPH